MQFINKFKYKRKGHRIIKAFIKDKWNNDIQRYVNLNYNELKRIKAFKYLLLKEQQGFCCYCMRKIPFNEVTLEHVMPHHLEDKKRKEEVKYYSKFGRLKRGKIYYCPDKEIPISPKLHTPPYPHCIAHENLVASCQGRSLKVEKNIYYINAAITLGEMIKLFHYFSFREQQRLYDMKLMVH